MCIRDSLRAVRIILHIVFVVAGDLGVDAGGVGAFAFQPGQMDVQPDGATVLCLHHIIKGVLLGEMCIRDSSKILADCSSLSSL